MRLRPATLRGGRERTIHRFFKRVTPLKVIVDALAEGEREREGLIRSW